MSSEKVSLGKTKEEECKFLGYFLSFHSFKNWLFSHFLPESLLHGRRENDVAGKRNLPLLSTDTVRTSHAQ